MTHPNFQTNGASLEDCHTNFFALTELSGIKWRKLVWFGDNSANQQHHHHGGVHHQQHHNHHHHQEPLDDPVLRSYARCLAADILCVWRRVAAPRHSNDVFELGPPPPAHPPPLNLSAAKELWIFWYGEEPDLNDLVAPELNASESEQGSWESGLSYKCRSLLFKALHNLIERCLLSRDFIRLGKWFVQPYDGPTRRPNGLASEDDANASAHLSFSFAFFVHGESTVCASVDVRQHPPVRRLTRQHIHHAHASQGVKVILAPFGLSGVLTGLSFKSPDASSRLLEEWSQFYPLDKSSGLSESSIVEVIVGGIKMRYPSCYVLVTDIDEASAQQPTKGAKVSDGPPSPVPVQTPPPSPVPITSKVPQPGPFSVSTEHVNSMTREPTAATILPERVWQECVHGGPPGCNNASGTVHEFNGQWDLVDPTKKVGCTCSKCPPAAFNQQEAPLSYPQTQESIAVPSVGSPPSVTPSPLPNPSSQQPASVPPGEQQMPTLSPHLSSPLNKSYTPEQSARTPNIASVKTEPVEPPEMAPLSPPQSHGPAAAPLECKSESKPEAHAGALKRPMLSGLDYESNLEDEETCLDLLYDYSTMEAWLNHPVKRFKGNIKDHQRITNAHKIDIYSLYTHNGISGANFDANPAGLKAIKQEIKQEPNSGECDAVPIATPHGVKRPGDPYEFEDGDATNPCNMDGFKRAPGAIKEEPTDGKKMSSANYFTSEALQPSYRDLDEIFDNSDDTSGDETIQIQTPPSSTMVSHEENKRFGGGHGTCPTMGILRPEELSKMFPTPPSLEHNPIASPCGQMDLQAPDFTDLTIAARVKQEIYPNMGSPQEENIEDWSYVFRPPVACKMVGSSKYAPLTNLPSQSQPPVQFPPHCLYRPSWMQHADKQTPSVQNGQAPAAVQGAPTSAAPLPPANPHSVPSRQATPQPAIHQRPNTPAALNPFSPGMAGFRPPPPPYEMPSPAGSIYMTKTAALDVPTPNAQNVNRLAPEGSALLLNILLTDTAFNIFRDHNFDSCTLCVCNGTGNIRGSDAGVYLTPTDSHHPHHSYHPYHPLHQNGVQTPESPYPGMGIGQPPPYGMISPTHQNSVEEDAISCSCGFSAVVNRRLAHGSGLFYEDEREITGITEDPAEKKKPSLVQYLTSISTAKHEHPMDRDQIETLSSALLDLIRDHCGVIPNTASALTRASDRAKTLARQRHLFSATVNILEYTDSNEVTVLALEQSRRADALGAAACKEDALRRPAGPAVHRWPFLRASGPRCNQDIVRVMRALRPLLQDAIQKKCQTRLWEAPSAVKGPLTWRQFHRLAGRGTDDRCEPQPIPSVVVGHERDWLSLSPYALQHWESLLLEPYSYSRDVAYIVVAPDNDSILARVRWFFRELSTAYEMCKLGRHSPITKVLRDGILRVGKTAKSKLGNEPVEDWFTMLGESEQTDMLKLYAQVCKHHLAPHLQQIPMDKTLLDPPPEVIDKPAPSPMPPPSTPDSQSSTPDKQPSTPKSEDGDCSKDYNLPSSHSNDTSHEDDEREAPCVVLYLVEPFSLGSDQPELQRLACLGLLRCFQSVLAALPDSVRGNVNVQLISLESILELGRTRERSRHSNHMRALSLSIFAQCRRMLVHTNNVKSLTGFGTAAMTDLFLKNKDEKNRAPYRLYTPPYILAPMREKVESAENFGKGNGDQASILYVSYCLSEDQSWLLAVATDERGELLESTTINVDIPNRTRRKKASARRYGLERLMNFIVGVLSQSARPWRLVIGRLGRIGHGELKGWSWLLSKKNLLRASQYLKEVCTQCSLMYPSNVPCILSACLVSLEPDTALRLMPDQFTPDERFGQASVNSQLQTPQDVSCTHILVFPTSATTQSQQTTFQEQQSTELGDEELFTIHEEMEDCIDEMQSSLVFSDIFSWGDSGVTGGQSPNGSPRRQESGPGSPNCGNAIGGQGSPFQLGSNSMKMSEQPEEVGQLLQQPLALGYLVSTAPTGRMPRWFWSACPHLEGVCPAFLKNALHLNSPNVQHNSDDLFPASTASAHPLDTNSTTDVLRYVLEGYNALSWLALDSNTRDRLSCLPAHMQVLIQLYHTASALF